MKHVEITDKIIAKFFKVLGKLGYGSLEKVYENALCIELEKAGFKIERQKKIPVYYDEKIVGSYTANIVVEGVVLLELKACDCLITEHEYQLLNYLRASTLEVGLLLNFGLNPEIKHKVYDNQKKKWHTISTMRHMEAPE
jgi:GxxExxY protein